MRIQYLMAALLAASRLCATDVQGNVSGVWEPGGNPYYVVGNVTVPVAQFLTILAGVEVRFIGDYSFTVLGGMTAWGTEVDSVKFVYNSGQVPGAWGYIEYNDSWGDSTVLKYCLIESGDRAVLVDNCGITLDHCTLRKQAQSAVKGQNNGAVNMISCNVTDNGGSGILLQGASIDLLDCSVTYNSGSGGHGISANGSGTIHVDGGYIGHNNGEGVYGVSTGMTTLENVEISHNGYRGVNLTLSGQLTASRVSIHDNSSHGIFLSNTSIHAHNLTVSSNGGSGVYCAFGTLELSSSIVDHNSNWGIFCQSPTDTAITYNDNYQNVSGGYYGCGPGLGSIAQDPLYVSLSNRDFNLTLGSPCIDAGRPADPLDPDGTRTDMGAFYYNQTPVWQPPPNEGAVKGFEIIAAYPNPFNSYLNIRISAATPARGILRAYSVDGRLIAQIWQGNLNPGYNSVRWEAEFTPSGAYLLHLQAGGTSDVFPCYLLK